MFVVCVDDGWCVHGMFSIVLAARGHGGAYGAGMTVSGPHIQSSTLGSLLQIPVWHPSYSPLSAPCSGEERIYQPMAIPMVTHMLCMAIPVRTSPVWWCRSTYSPLHMIPPVIPPRFPALETRPFGCPPHPGVSTFLSVVGPTGGAGWCS